MLYKAFEEARQAALRRMAETAASRYMLPWLYAEAERSQQLMGPDFWSYGLAGNEAALGVFLRILDQGLARRMLPGGAVRPRDQGKLRDLMSLRRGRRCP